MFYEEETSPCQVEAREDDQTNILQGKHRLRLLVLFNFVAMMTNRARLRHGTPFGADALVGEDIHPFFRTVQADQGHARRSLCGTGVAPARQETGVFPDRKTCDKKKKGNKKKRKEKHFVQSGL